MHQSQLKAFHHVALQGGFSNAARALNQTQPAISEQVRKLEQAYDVLLFIREHRSVRLTKQGEQLFLLTRQLFEVEDRITDYLSQSRTTVDGTLRIIVDSAHHITDILGRFRARYPRVFVSLRTGNTAEVLQSLRSYSAEIGVLGSQITSRDMEVHDLGATQIVACASRDFPLPA
ncbi:MAG: LysR family transcriptional regulator, partial [Rhodobacteraceae bacterium]|nr:LysR family transcriptional regulator [Paracoccaceae bacterium]